MANKCGDMVITIKADEGAGLLLDVMLQVKKMQWQEQDGTLDVKASLEKLHRDLLRLVEFVNG